MSEKMNQKAAWLSALGQRFLSVGVVSADWSALMHSLAPLDNRRDWLHLDIMDGHFCPGLTMGPWVIKHLPKGFIIDAHLMTANPSEVALQCADAGAHVITVQYEACRHIHSLLKTLGDKQAVFENQTVAIIRGVTLCPGTPVTVLKPIIHELEMVQLLAVDPGYGTKLDSTVLLDRIAAVKQLADACHAKPLLSIDGSLTLPAAQAVVQAGANVIVSGSAIFKSSNTAENLAEWHRCLVGGKI